MVKIIPFFMNQQAFGFGIEIDNDSLVIAWEAHSTDSGNVTVIPGGMDTTVSITSGSFFTISTDGTNYGSSDISETGSYTLYVKAPLDNDGTINTGEVTISDDDSNADDLVIDVTQQANPN